MKLYISCESAFALKADGQFLGRFCDACVMLSKPRFIECIPLSGEESVCFFADYRLKSRKNALVHLLDDGLYVQIFPRINTDTRFYTCLQKELCGALVTVYRQGTTRIVCENRTSAEIAEVPHGFDGFCAEQIQHSVAVFSSGTPKYLAIFEVGAKIRLLFANVVDDFEFTPVFRTKTRLFNIEQTTVTCEWSSALDSVCGIIPEHKRPYRAPLGKHVLRRAFFQSILLHLPFEHLLCDSLKPHADKLRGYLGGFVDVLPDYCSKKGACLSYEGNDRRPVKTFDIELCDGFISNVKEV